MRRILRAFAPSRLALLGFLMVGSPVGRVPNAEAAPPAVTFGPDDVRSALFVRKSENKNEVHYGVRLDDRCVPRGTDPIFAYWKMRERGPHVTEPLLDRERPAYGIAAQSVAANLVRVRLHALPDRTLVFEARPTDGRCAVRVLGTVDKRPAQLRHVFAKIGFLRVEYLLVEGIGLDRGEVLRERIVP